MRSLRERIVHTALFEIIAIVLVTPTVSWFTGASLSEAGFLSVLISIGAILANYVWTLVFDQLVPTRRRGFGLRALHAVGLEVLITAYTIPLVILLTKAPLLTAVILDVTGIGFFIVFSMAYNAIFDAVMLRLTARAGPPVSS